MTIKKIDRLSTLIQHFRISAHVLPQTHLVSDQTDRVDPHANLFILAKGQLILPEQDNPEAPVLLFFPHGTPEGVRYHCDQAEKAYVGAFVDTGSANNPITQALPDCVKIPLVESDPLSSLSDMLLEEALSPRCGAQAVIDRLCEIVVIRLLRHLIETNKTKAGLIAGLAHPNLSHALVAMHDQPQKSWNLEDLADLAAMSRSQFANVFRETVGVTPGEYLSNWRLSLAHIELTRGATLKSVVTKVGFSSAAALSRAFKRHFGLTPRELSTIKG